MNFIVNEHQNETTLSNEQLYKDKVKTRLNKQELRKVIIKEKIETYNTKEVKLALYDKNRKKVCRAA